MAVSAWDKVSPRASEGGENQRREPRVPVCCPANLWPIASISSIPMRVTVEEVSLSGLRICAPEQLTPGYYRLIVADREQAEKVTYEVRWCRRCETGWQCGMDASDSARRPFALDVGKRARRRRVMCLALAICVLVMMELVLYATY